MLFLQMIVFHFGTNAEQTALPVAVIYEIQTSQIFISFIFPAHVCPDLSKQQITNRSIFKSPQETVLP